jgi:hypothetical protein
MCIILMQVKITSVNRQENRVHFQIILNTKIQREASLRT